MVQRPVQTRRDRALEGSRLSDRLKHPPASHQRKPGALRQRRLGELEMKFRTVFTLGMVGVLLAGGSVGAQQFRFRAGDPSNERLALRVLRDYRDAREIRDRASELRAQAWEIREHVRE